MRAPAQTPHRLSPSAGFTLVELLVTVGLISILAGMGAMIMPGAVAAAKADAGASRVESALRVAREQAIAQRRTVRVAFTPPNRVVTSRVEVPGPGTTVLTTTELEDGMTFQLYSGVPDTPDAFGRSSATSFGMASSISFSSEGTFVDQNGDPINGTVFLGRSSKPLTARAVTIFGPTALVRSWKWKGNAWTR